MRCCLNVFVFFSVSLTLLMRLVDGLDEANAVSSMTGYYCLVSFVDVRLHRV